MTKVIVSLFLVLSMLSSAIVTPHAVGRLAGLGVAKAAPAMPMPVSQATPATSCMPDEADDTSGAAKAIGDHATLAAAICPSGDKDYFKFHADKGEKVAVQLSNLPVDLTLCVGGPAVSETCSSNSGTNAEEVNLTAASSGPHYAYVYGAGGASSPKSYVLDVAAGPGQSPGALIVTSYPGVVSFSSTRFQTIEDTSSARVRANVVLSGTIPSAPKELDVIIADPATGDSEQVRLSMLKDGSYGNAGLEATEKVSTANDGKLYTEKGNLIYVTYTWKGQGDGATGDYALISGGTPSGKFTVQIDSKILAEPKTLPGRGSGEPDRPVAAVSAKGAPPVRLGEDMVILDPRSPNELEAFRSRYQAAVVQEREQGGMSVLRVNLAPMSQRDKTDFQVLGEWLGFEGEMIFSSDAAHALYNMILFENFDGVRVTFNPLMMLFGEPTSPEEPATGADPELDVMDEWWANDPNIQTDHAWTLAALMDLDAEAVNLAVIDGGFRTGDDVPPLVDGWDYEDDDADPYGTNPVSCSGDSPCPWHGDWVWGAAGAVVNNGANVGGAGGQVAQPMFYRTGYSSWLFDMDDVFRRATLAGADVINFSAGIPCELGGIHYCNPGVRGGLCAAVFFVLPALMLLGPGVALLLSVFSIGLGVFCFNVFNPESIFADAAAFAAGHNTVVVAAAGNAVGIGSSVYGPYDVADVRVVPCIVDNVICVGEMANDYTLRNNWGADVDIWGPNALPRSGDVTQDLFGTSGTTGFISGVVALLKSVNRDLTPAEILTILQDTAHASGPAPEIHHFVDVYDAFVAAADTDAEQSAEVSQLRLFCPSVGFDETDTTNDTRATADVIAAGLGDIGPIEDAAVHTFGDEDDWFRYSLPEDVEGRFYRIGWVFSWADRAGRPDHLLYADLPDGLESTSGQTVWPNTYYSNVTADSASDSCYALRGTIAGGQILPDRYEMNNDLPSGTVLDLWAPAGENTYQLVVRDLTIHEAADADVFHIDIPDGAGIPTISPCAMQVSGGFNILLDRPDLRSPIYIETVYDSDGTAQPVDNSGIEVDVDAYDGLWVQNGLSFEIAGDPVEAEPDDYDLTIEYSVPDSEDVSRLCTVWEDISRIIDADIAANGTFRPIPSMREALGERGFPFDLPCDPRDCDPPATMAADWLGFIMDEDDSIAVEVRVQATSQIRFHLFDLAGNELGEMPMPAATAAADSDQLLHFRVDGLTAGVYLLKVSDGAFGERYALRVYDPTPSVYLPSIIQ